MSLRRALRDPGLRRVLVTTALVHAASLAFIVLAYLFVVGGAPDAESLLTRALVRWDAKNYLKMAEGGYSDVALAPFFPLYPLTVAAVGLLVGLLPASLVVSFVGHLAAAALLFALLRLDQSRAVAWRAVLMLLAFPTAFVTVLPYTESLFLALTLGSLFAFRKERHLLAGVLGALAAATRITGLALVPALLAEFEFAQRGRVPAWRALAGCALPLLGFAAYLLVNEASFGSPFFFMGISEVHYTKTLAWPTRGLTEAIGNLHRPVPENITIGFCDLLGTALAWTAGLYALHRRRPGDAAYALASATLITVQSWWLSNLRYAFVIFPVYLMLAQASARTWARTALLVAGIVLQAILALQFARGHWTM